MEKERKAIAWDVMLDNRDSCGVGAFVEVGQMVKDLPDIYGASDDLDVNAHAYWRVSKILAADFGGDGLFLRVAVIIEEGEREE
jgi:hypothetical protein